jgi:uncharacterized protein (DUF1697 family)
VLYLVLLRGINVGGKSLIRMPELKAAFEAGGFEEVATYIQSGNVLFRSPRAGTAELTRGIEEMLGDRFGYPISVVLRNHAQMRAVVETAPGRFGADSSKYLYDVAFLKPPLTASAVAKEVPTKPGIDEVHTGKGVVYLSRLASRATLSRINRIASLPSYKNMTLRSWSTTTKLLRLMDEF